MSPLSLLIAIFCAMSVAMMIGWTVQRARANGGWTDVFWSYAVGLVGAAAALAPVGAFTAPSLRQILVAVLVGLWSIRLGGHIAGRTIGAPEDARYAALRRRHGPRFQEEMFIFLQIQAAAGGFLILTVALAAHNPASGLRLIDLVGAGLFLTAVLGEAAADAQLRRFKADKTNHGKVCAAGLWAWSRHPNYFFEWMGWVAYAVIALDLRGGYMAGWLAWSGPAFMFYLLRYVSGVPLLEAAMAESRGPAYVRYQASVSAFFPWPPKRRAAADGSAT
jgi:steroid 5-alpha reductase family enzyme